MFKKKFKSTENDFFILVKNILNNFSAKLNDHLIQAELHPVKVSFTENNLYNSEIVIYFWRNKKILNVVEFFIYHDSSLVATKEEIESYLKENIESMLNAID